MILVLFGKFRIGNLVACIARLLTSNASCLTKDVLFSPSRLTAFVKVQTLFPSAFDAGQVSTGHDYSLSQITENCHCDEIVAKYQFNLNVKITPLNATVSMHAGLCVPTYTLPVAPQHPGDEPGCHPVERSSFCP